MNLSSSPDRARDVAGPKSAARLYADIEYELAMGDPNFDDEHHGENALRILEDRFPGVKGASDTVVENGHVPKMSRKAWNATGGESKSPRDPSPRGSGTPPPAAARPAVLPPRARAAVSRRRGRSPGRAWRQTGIPAVATGSGGLGLQLLGGFLLLSLTYLILSPNGARGFSSLLGGLTTGLNVFVGTGDPFAKRKPAAAAAKPGPIQQALQSANPAAIASGPVAAANPGAPANAGGAAGNILGLQAPAPINSTGNILAGATG